MSADEFNTNAARCHCGPQVPKTTKFCSLREPTEQRAVIFVTDERRAVPALGKERHRGDGMFLLYILRKQYLRNHPSIDGSGRKRTNILYARAILTIPALKAVLAG